MSNTENRHTENSIKNSFDNNKRKAPEGLWSSIASTTHLSDDDFKIKESFNNIEKTVPSESWKNIKKQLIIDDVWENILGYHKRRRKLFWIWSIAGILLLFGTTTTYLLNSNSSNLIVSKSDNNNNNNNNNNNSFLNTNTKDQSSLANDFISNQTTYKNESSPFNATNKKTEEEEPTDFSLKNDFPNLISHKAPDSVITYSSDRDKIDKLVIPIGLLSETNHKSTVIPLEFEIDQKPKIKKYEIGLIAGLNNTWILNNDVRNGLSQRSLIDNELSFGSNFGIVANYNFNYRSGLSLNYDFISTINQHYHMFSHGNLYHREIHIKQTKISLQHKLNLSKSTYQNRYFTLKSGVYFSYAQQTLTQGDLSENDFKFDYNNIDFGIKVAFGHEYKFDHFKLSYGLQSDFGLLNISEDSPGIPKKFKYTNTYLMGSYVSFRYLF